MRTFKIKERVTGTVRSRPDGVKRQEPSNPALQRHKAKLLAERLGRNRVMRNPVFGPAIISGTATSRGFVLPPAVMPGYKGAERLPVKTRDAASHVRVTPKAFTFRDSAAIRTRSGITNPNATVMHSEADIPLPSGWKRSDSGYVTPTGRTIPLAAIREPDAFFAHIRTKENPGGNKSAKFSARQDFTSAELPRVRTKPRDRILMRIGGAAVGTAINAAASAVRDAAAYGDENQAQRSALSAETAHTLGTAVLSSAAQSGKSLYRITKGYFKYTLGIPEKVPTAASPQSAAAQVVRPDIPAQPQVRTAPQSARMAPETPARTAQTTTAVPLVNAPLTSQKRAEMSALPVRTKNNQQSADSVRVKPDADKAFIRTKENSAKKDADASDTGHVKSRSDNERTKTRDSKRGDKQKSSGAADAPRALAIARTIGRVQSAIRSAGGSVSGEDNDVAKLLALPFKMLGRKLLMWALPAIAGFIAQLLPPFLLFMAIFASPLGVFFSSEDVSPNTVSIPSVFAQCNYEAGQIVNGWVEETTAQAKADYGDETEIRVRLEGSFSDPVYVLAVWAVKTAAAEDGTAMDVLQITSEKADGLSQVFRDMNRLGYATEVDWRTVTLEDGSESEAATVKLTVTSTHMDLAAAADFYLFSDSQREILYELTTEYYDMLKAVVGNLQLSTAEAQQVLKNLPDDLSPERRAIITNGLTLVGKVTYFWGGKSFNFGWDDNWGRVMLVTATGSESTGTYRAFGLDCSGFIGWSYINGFGEKSVFARLGYTSNYQYSSSTPVSYYDAMPGDLAFYKDSDGDISHVGIIAGRTEDGSDWLVVHCDSASGVTISEFTRYGFWSIARPNLFKDYGEVF